MAFAATMSTEEPRSYSEGPLKKQFFTWTCASGDTSGTITADALTSVVHVMLDGGLSYTAAPTFSGNVATIAFTDPVANSFGTGVAWGK